MKTWELPQLVEVDLIISAFIMTVLFTHTYTYFFDQKSIFNLLVT